MNSMDRWLLLAAISLVSSVMLAADLGAQSKARIQKQPFGKTADQKGVDLYTLTNTNGMEARIMTLGGVVVSLKTPDRNGKLGDVVLGYGSLEGYLAKPVYFGCIIGRYGN